MATLSDILRKGYFPRELPPAFTTTPFASAVVGSGGYLKPAFTEVAEKRALLCIHNMVRSGGLRRDLGISNPGPFSLLAEFTAGYWTKLQQEGSRSPFSLTKPVNTKSERAISPEHDLNVRTLRRIDLRSHARFILRTDISRFYPSIYTHSFPWAIHTKAKVKEAMGAKDLKSLWANSIDVLARNQNDQQTVGIPIGNDISLLLSEILLSAVDCELVTQIPKLRGIRFIDDYEFAVSQRSEAEKIVSVLQKILSQYELALNPTKTRIVELPDVIEPLWASRLRTFLFRGGGFKTQRNDLTAYFDNVFTLAKAEPEDAIFKFAIPRLNSVLVEEDNWPIVEKLLSQCAVVEPACLPQVCEQITDYASSGYPVNKDLWSETLNWVITERLTLGQASEALWALWLMKHIGVTLVAAAQIAVDQCDDSTVALMGLELARLGLADPKLFIRLHSFAEPVELTGRQWLLCYQGNQQGSIKPPSGADTLRSNSQFEYLSKNGVSFFDETAVPPPARRNAATSAGGGGSGTYPM